MGQNWRVAFANVRSALMRRGHSEHEAEDLVQEAWLRMAARSESSVIDQPQAFLMRTALNLSIDEYRARASRGVEVLVEEVTLVDARPSVEATLLARERIARLGACLGRLSWRARAMLLAHRMDGRSYQDIALEHGLSITAVEKHVAKATLQLTTWMEGW